MFQSFSKVFMKSRSSFERYFHPLDVAVGLSFVSNFHFAFVTHLLKGKRCTKIIYLTHFLWFILSLFCQTIFVRSLLVWKSWPWILAYREIVDTFSEFPQSKIVGFTYPGSWVRGKKKYFRSGIFAQGLWHEGDLNSFMCVSEASIKLHTALSPVLQCISSNQSNLTLLY